MAKNLLDYLIYPEESDYKEVTAEYLSAEHEEFFSSMSDTKWDTYFKKNIASPVNKFLF